MFRLTTIALKNMLVTFLSEGQVYQFYLIHVIKISFVEIGKMQNTVTGFQKSLSLPLVKVLCSKLIVSELQKSCNPVSKISTPTSLMKLVARMAGISAESTGLFYKNKKLS